MLDMLSRIESFVVLAEHNCSQVAGTDNQVQEIVCSLQRIRLAESPPPCDA